MPAGASMCHLSVLCSLDACLLAWHLKLVVMKRMSVQVCCESIGHAEAVQRTLNRLYCGVVDLLCPPGITPPHPTELAMMSTHSTHPAEEYHTEKQKQVGRCAAVPLLACRPWI